MDVATPTSDCLISWQSTLKGARTEIPNFAKAFPSKTESTAVRPWSRNEKDFRFGSVAVLPKISINNPSHNLGQRKMVTLKWRFPQVFDERQQLYRAVSSISLYFGTSNITFLILQRRSFYVSEEPIQHIFSTSIFPLNNKMVAVTSCHKKGWKMPRNTRQGSHNCWECKV